MIIFLKKYSHLALDILTINKFHLPKAIIEREGIYDRVLRHNKKELKHINPVESLIAQFANPDIFNEDIQGSNFPF